MTEATDAVEGFEEVLVFYFAVAQCPLARDGERRRVRSCVRREQAASTPRRNHQHVRTSASFNGRKCPSNVEISSLALRTYKGMDYLQLTNFLVQKTKPIS